MAAIPSLRILGSLPSLSSLGLGATAFAIGGDRLDGANAVGLLVGLVLLMGLIAANRLRRVKGAERAALLVAGSMLLYVALYVRPLDVLALYVLLLLIVVAGQFHALGAMIGPLGGKELVGAELSEARRTILAILLRLGVVLLVAFFLSALLWNSMAGLNLGPTADLTAFLLAALLILLITLLLSLPESVASD